MLTSNIPYVVRAYYEWILDNQCTPYLLVNAEADAVCVPIEHVKNGQIVLNISPVASNGLLIENDGVSFKARFSGVPREIYVPITSVLAIYARENGRGMAFSKGSCIEMNPAPLGSDTPAEGNKNAASSVNSDKKVGANLQGVATSEVVKGESPSDTGGRIQPQHPSKKPKGKPSLTIVK